MKRLLLLPCFLFLSFSLNAQTYVPDDAFELALIDLGFDTGTPMIMSLPLILIL